MALAAPPTSVVAIAERLRTSETQLRRMLPQATTEVTALALQAMDGAPSLLSPKTVARVSTPLEDPSQEAIRLQALAQWEDWASSYQGILDQLLSLVGDLSRRAASESPPAR
jgi:hypothetical protein